MPHLDPTHHRAPPVLGTRPCQKPHQRRRGKRGARVEGRRRPEYRPEPSGDDACGEQGYSGDEVKHAEGRAVQIGRRGIGHECRQQPLGRTHVQAPQGRAGTHQPDVAGQSQDEVGGDDAAHARCQQAATVAPEGHAEHRRARHWSGPSPEHPLPAAENAPNSACHQSLANSRV